MAQTNVQAFSGDVEVAGGLQVTGSITGAVVGNADTATALATARTINGVSFDGTGNIVVEPYISDYDTGDTSCYLVFTRDSTAGYKRLYEDSGLIYDNTNNRLRLAQIMLGDQNTYGLGAVTGQYGSVGTVGTGKGSYEGYSINGEWVFMSNGAGACGIYNDTNNQWGTRWLQNGSTDLYYNNSNKFQTTNDGAHCSGALYADHYYVDDYIYHNGNTTTRMGFGSNIIYLRTNGSDRVTINSSGNVGFGTNGPEYKLHVEDGSNPRIMIENTDTVLAVNQDIGSILFKQNDITAGTGTGIIGKIRMSSVTAPPAGTFYGESANMIFSVGNYASDNANIDALTIRGNGNVGIGTTNPATQLEIRGQTTSTIPTIRLTNTAPGNDVQDLGGLEVYSVDGGGDFCGSIIVRRDNTGAAPDGNIVFRTGQNGASRDRMIIKENGNIGIGTATPKTNFGMPAFEVYNGVIMSGQRSNSTDTNYSMHVGKGGGDGWLTGFAPDGKHCFAFYNNNLTISGGWSGAGSAFYISKNNATGRSINATGTFNGNGSDYAEYVRKKDIDMVINKGDIVGIDSNAQLTNVFSESVTFVVKSTDPSFTGGGNWGIDLDMHGPQKPNELKSDASEEEQNTYNLELQNWESKKLIWEEQHENARKPYDRIAFCGQVPVNVYNTTPGQYVIPKQTDDDTISYELTNTPTFEQYQISIGKVIKIQEDGRAWIIVKIL